MVMDIYSAIATNILVIILAIGLYFGFCIFLNRFHKLVYGKETILAFVPICNTYLLGKLAVNNAVGIFLVVLGFLPSFLPEAISYIVSTLYEIGVIGLFLYSIIKYFKRKKDWRYNN